MKMLDVGAGLNKYPGAMSIDSNALSKPDFLHDLNIFPWPIPDNEFDRVYSSHCLEHLGDPKKAVEEIWRVGKPGAEVVIKVPHCSSRVAWTDIEHTRGFSMHSFRRFSPESSRVSGNKMILKLEKVKLIWQQRMDMEFLPVWAVALMPVVRVLSVIISFLANIQADFCERIWCYYVGGFGEIEYTLRIVKE